jgi:PmbA protein
VTERACGLSRDGDGAGLLSGRHRQRERVIFDGGQFMSDYELLDSAGARQIFEQVLAAAASLGVPDVEWEVSLDAERSALTRYASNAIHQNVAEESMVISARAVTDQRTARASTNRTDRDSLRRLVDRALTLARAAEPDERVLPVASSAVFQPIDRFSPATAGCSPRERAEAVREAIAIIENEGQTAAGAYSTEASSVALFNTAGVAALHSETMARFSVSALDNDSSGWAKASSTDHRFLDAAALARSASRKASLSRAPVALEPGRYTVILEPAAVLDLAGQIIPDFSGTALHEQRSFLNGRMGEKLFGANISIVDDVRHPLQSGAPFDGEGVPRRRLGLVDSGIPREAAWSRSAAAEASREPTGHGFPLPNEEGEAPMNVVIAGGQTSLDEMIRATQRGILVTRFWYIREVDPFTKSMTGMTRDGTFLVEGGELAGGIHNFRFNQSVVELLNNVEMLGPSVRASGEEMYDMVAPPMKAHDFRFTERTTF